LLTKCYFILFKKYNIAHYWFKIIPAEDQKRTEIEIYVATHLKAEVTNPC